MEIKNHNLPSAMFRIGLHIMTKTEIGPGWDVGLRLTYKEKKNAHNEDVLLLKKTTKTINYCCSKIY